MIVIKVELWSAVTHKITEIARMRIANVGGTQEIGDYEAVTFFGRDKRRLDQSMLGERTTRRGTVSGHPRLREHVWHLVAKSLNAMGYGATLERQPEAGDLADLCARETEFQRAAREGFHAGAVRR